MSRIFLSHSSRDNREALALKRWLKTQRPELRDDIFLDIDPDAGLQPGQRWKSELFKSNSRCEAVICLLSASWESSHECKTEYRTAEGLGKQILCARLEDFADTDVTSEWQRCDLFAEGAKTQIELAGGPPVSFNSAALDQLLKEVEGTGIGADNFLWPPTRDVDRAPYRGWDPFEDIDAGVFFGRDAATVRGLDELRAMRRSGFKSLFVVLGPSGSGKSSFLRAGLLPRLRRADREFLPLGILRPQYTPLTGDTGLAAAIRAARRDVGLRGIPLSEIENACVDKPGRIVELLVELRAAAAARLADAGREGLAPTLVLPLDQAEELFSADAGPQAEQFMALIADLLVQINATEIGLIVAATIRTDRYEVMQNHPALDGINTVLFNELKPMPASQFKDVITGPAGRTADTDLPVQFAPDLVNRLLVDATEGADTLPLLSLTLARLYTDWTDLDTTELTLANYEAMGGMADVVNNEIDEILARDSHDRATALALLRSAFIPWLATVNPDTDQPLRRVSRYTDLPELSRPLIDALVSKRLLVKDTRDGHVVVEVALESLLRQWDELAGWIREQRQNLINADDLHRAATAWEVYNHDPAWLLTGTRLTDAETLADTSEFRNRLTNTRDYLTASRDAEDQRVAAEKQHQEAKLRDAEAHAAALRKRARILRAVLAGTAVVAVIALIGVIGFARANDQSQKRYRAATALRLEAEAQNILSGNRAGTDAEAIQEVLAAHALAAIDNPTPDAGSLLDAQVNRYSTLKIIDTRRPLRFMAVSPTGDRVATTCCNDSTSPDVGARLWDAATGEPIGKTLTGDNGVAFSPDGNRVAAASSDGNVRMFDASTGHLLRTFTGPTAAATRVVFSPDGHRVAAGSGDGSAWVWNVDTGAPQLTLRGHRGFVYTVAFSPNGQLIATGGADKTVWVWRADNGAPLHTLEGGSEINSVAFSPAGLLASGGTDGHAHLWDPQAGTPVGDPTIPLSTSEPISSVAWNPRPATSELAAVSEDHKVSIWNVISGEFASLSPETELDGQSVDRRDAAFAADGNRLFAGGADGVVQVWSPTIGNEIDTTSIGVWVTSAAYSPDGQRLAVGAYDGDADRGNVGLWSPHTGRPLGAPLPGHGGQLDSVAFDPAEDLVAAGERDATVPLWNPTSGRLVRTLSVPGAPTDQGNNVAFSADGHLLASGNDATVRLWDPDSGQLKRTLTGPADTVTVVAFSSAEHLLAAGCADHDIYLWDTDTGELRQKVSTPTPVLVVAFSPDGRRLVSGGTDNMVRLWDTQSGQPAMGPLTGHTNWVSGVAYSPDGRLIASDGSDQRIRFWDAVTGTPVGSPIRTNGNPLRVAYSPDGQQIATTGTPSELQLWPASPSVAQLCAKLTANPSHKQWNKWVASGIGYMPVCPGLPTAPDGP